MKTIILAGGVGSRLEEETAMRPKPMIEIGGKPLLWHIMNIYSAHGIREFIVALGYKADVVKEYFLNFYTINNDVSIDLATGQNVVHHRQQQDRKVHLVDTGLETLTGGRVRRLRDWLGEDDTFLLTYGDGVADIDIATLIEFHRGHGKLATMTSVVPPARFGAIVSNGDQVIEFTEKPHSEDVRVNGGFFVLSREVLAYIEGDQTSWEADSLPALARDGELMAYRHDGFWQPMDTLREKRYLEGLWASGDPPWKIWT